MGPDHCLVMAKKANFMSLWECRDMGETTEFLWMKIHCQGNVYLLEQKDYLSKVLEKTSMMTCHTM